MNTTRTVAKKYNQDFNKTKKSKYLLWAHGISVANLIATV